MKEYVCGLLFNELKTRVLLIHKDHGPQHLVDKWNGIGGVIKPGETPEQTMVREFKEETNLWTRPKLWKQPFMTLQGLDWTVYFFAAKGEAEFALAGSPTAETVRRFMVGMLPWNVALDLKWILPMALICEQESAAYIVKQM